MATPPAPAPLRQAHRAWNLLHVDSAQARALAERAIAAARHGADVQAEAWARLALGFHLLYYATTVEAAAGALVGSVMKDMRGQADAAKVKDLILSRLAPADGETEARLG